MCPVFPKHILKVHTDAAPVTSCKPQALQVEDLSYWELIKTHMSKLLSKLIVMWAAVSTQQERRGTDKELVFKSKET